MITLATLGETLLGTGVTTLFALWLVLTLAQYVPTLTWRILRQDRLMLIPQWAFFAPQPNRADFFFFVRHADACGQLSAWREITLARPRRWFAFAWNPDRRIRKALFDLIVEICRMVDQPRTTLLLSVPYLHLLVLATAVARSQAQARQVQFCLARTVPSEDEASFTVLFCSELHPMD